jgi:transcriptional regulator with XRE-family HTH domain
MGELGELENEGGDAGDLGRRVAERRAELGLSREQVSAKAGIVPGYLAYLEERPGARPSSTALLHLAAALETTVAVLQGAGTGRPPGAGSPPAGLPILEVLPPSACWERLTTGGIGRVVFDSGEGPTALPVNYRVLDGDIVFRTGKGSIAHAVTAGGVLGFEVDHLDEALGEGWSVLVRGGGELVADEEEIGRIKALAIEPWAGGERRLYVRLRAAEVSGRLIRRRR